MATSIARLKRGPGTLSGINHVDSIRREYSPITYPLYYFPASCAQ